MTQSGFVKSNCFSDLTTLRKMIATIEEEKPQRQAKRLKTFATSAVGLEAWAKEIGLLGWASGLFKIFRCGFQKCTRFLTGKFSRYLKLHYGISPKAMDMLAKDDEEYGTESVLTLSALSQTAKGSGSSGSK